MDREGPKIRISVIISDEKTMGNATLQVPSKEFFSENHNTATQMYVHPTFLAALIQFNENSEAKQQ